MYVKRIKLTNYRNYSDLDVQFDKNNNYITGDNGIGKTNIIEAIYYLTIGRSFRKVEDKDLIQHGFKTACIYLDYYDEVDESDHHISALISKGYKSFAYDDEKIKSLSKILGKLIAVYYEPSSVFLFKNEPDNRRKVLDVTLSQVSQDYLYAISRYKKLLKERNIALQRDYDNEVIEVMRNELINLSYRIVKNRNDFLKIASKSANDYYNKLFNEGTSTINLNYKTNCPLDDDQESYVKNSIQLFQRNQSIENIKKTTFIGPHRDDFSCLLNQKDISEFGSQGENRLASLSLKLSIADILSKKTKKKTILLLDDIASDLDDKRINNLLKNISLDNQQMIITGTQIHKGFENYKILNLNKEFLEGGMNNER